ncbi:MAG: PD-(D/E)XK nuclease family transposase [Thioploca sp.]|nr:PD-(D/E)XK nuclease family transposase [Thioploca sp.]
MSRYLNPYTDFGFKKLFGEEGNKDLLTDFLNQLLPPYHQIGSLQFKNPENLPDLPLERKAIFDIYCQSVTGENFIVEMQKAKLHFFKDRALFYSTFPIRDQAKKGEWDFKLTPVYYVAILDFKYDEVEEQHKLLREVALKDQEGQLFYDKLHFKFLQMPLFTKREHELATHFDKWLYFLKNLESFEQIPAILNEPLFQKAFETLEEANLSPEQREQYQKSLLTYWELKGVVDTAREEGREEGRLEGILQVARMMKQNGLAIEVIQTMTGLTPNEIEEL